MYAWTPILDVSEFLIAIDLNIWRNKLVNKPGKVLVRPFSSDQVTKGKIGLQYWTMDMSEFLNISFINIWRNTRQGKSLLGQPTKAFYFLASSKVLVVPPFCFFLHITSSGS